MTITEASQSVGLSVYLKSGYSERLVLVTGISACKRYVFVQHHSGCPSVAVAPNELRALEGVHR